MKQNQSTASGEDSRISVKLNALLALNLKMLLNDRDFSSSKKRKQGTGDLVNYFSKFGLDAADIAQILGTSVESVRTLLTPKRRKE